MARQTTISTIRHAQTVYNAEKRYAGSIDISLSEKGRLDAHIAASKLAGMQFDVVIISPLRRAVETAHILVPGHGRIVEAKLCTERNFGSFEGHTWEEVKHLDAPVLWIEVGNDIHSVNPHGSEPFEQVWARARKFSNMLFRDYNGLNILVVSHGVFLQMFHGNLRGLSCIESLAFYPGNLELATFHFDGKRLVDERTISLIGSGKADF